MLEPLSLCQSAGRVGARGAGIGRAQASRAGDADALVAEVQRVLLVPRTRGLADVRLSSAHGFPILDLRARGGRVAWPWPVALPPLPPGC